jgi:hypothetical protein
MTPTSQRITSTMMITPMIPMPPLLFISISRSASHQGHQPISRDWRPRILVQLSLPGTPVATDIRQPLRSSNTSRIAFLAGNMPSAGGGARPEVV